MKRIYKDSKDRTWVQVWDPQLGWIPPKPPVSPQEKRKRQQLKQRESREKAVAKAAAEHAALLSALMTMGRDGEKPRKKQKSGKSMGKMLKGWVPDGFAFPLARDKIGAGVFVQGGGIETKRRKH